MYVTEYRLGRQHRTVVDRVDQIMFQAAGLISRKERYGVGAVEIAVTVEDGIPDVVCAAHEQLFGRSDWDSWAGGGQYGLATIAPFGTLIVLDAQALKGRTTEIDKTLLHELMHAAQFSRPGIRDLAMRAIAFDYEIGWLEDRELRDLSRLIDRHEREARQSERLHRELAKAVA